MDSPSSHMNCYRYNVQCRQGQILHYIVAAHTLQGPEEDPPETPEPICVDFLGEGMVLIEKWKINIHFTLATWLFTSLGTISG